MKENWKIKYQYLMQYVENDSKPFLSFLLTYSMSFPWPPLGFCFEFSFLSLSIFSFYEHIRTYNVHINVGISSKYRKYAVLFLEMIVADVRAMLNMHFCFFLSTDYTCSFIHPFMLGLLVLYVCIHFNEERMYSFEYRLRFIAKKWKNQTKPKTKHVQCTVHIHVKRERKREHFVT